MDSKLEELTDRAVKYASEHGAQYIDARAEEYELKSILIENGEVEHVRVNKDTGIGFRLIKDGTWSFSSITNPNSFEQVKDTINNSLHNSSHCKKSKKQD